MVKSKKAYTVKYSSPKISEALFKRAEKYIEEHPEEGYRSVSELVSDLLRKKLDSTVKSDS